MKEKEMDGNICYYFSFSIYDGSRPGGKRETELRQSIKENFPAAVFYDEAEGEKEKFFRELKTAQDFLHGGGLPFPCFRVLLKEYDLKMEGLEIFDSAVFMTVFPDSDMAQVCVCISVKEGSGDDFVYLRHLQGNGRELNNRDGRKLSVRRIFEEAAQSLGRPVDDVEETYLVEIKKFGAYDSVEQIFKEQLPLIYGMMCGDEGWRNVPEELASQRMENQWGSRDFIRFVTFGSNAIFFNLSSGQRAERYREQRRLFDQKYYGDMNPYFLLDSNVAGVNHGILFSLELVMVIKTICNRILRRQAAYYADDSSSLKADIRKTKAYRGELITTLNKVENLSISEMGELERVILRSQEIEPVIEKIKYLLELLESELDLLYQNSTNNLINLLTVAGLVLAAVQVLQGIF